MAKHRGTGEVRIWYSMPHEGIWEILKVGQGECLWSPTEINELYYAKDAPDDSVESPDERPSSDEDGKPRKK